jgi:hypothetical protein
MVFIEIGYQLASLYVGGGTWIRYKPARRYVVSPTTQPGSLASENSHELKKNHVISGTRLMLIAQLSLAKLHFKCPLNDVISL